MRSLLLLLALPLPACHAIVGSYEVGETDAAVTDASTADSNPADASGPDTSTADTTRPDTGVADTADSGVVVKSCAALRAAGDTTNGNRLIIAKGTPGYPEGVETFCDMMGGGWTLVATRSSTTAGSVWAATGAENTLKTKKMGPNEDVDGVLDIDWNALGFSDVAYELGLPSGTGMRMPRTRATFPMLDARYLPYAKPALFTHLTGADKRPDCILSMGGTSYKECIIPMGTFVDGGAMPPQSLGWLFAPNGVECFFAYQGKVGTQDCVTGAVGGGRIFVK